MKKAVSDFFKGIKQMISGKDGVISLRRSLALGFSIDFIYNLHYIFTNWELGRSYADASMLFGIEAGLIAALLSLTTYNNIAHINKDKPNGPDILIENQQIAPQDQERG